jgi:hypothetical protein
LTALCPVCARSVQLYTLPHLSLNMRWTVTRLRIMRGRLANTFWREDLDIRDITETVRYTILHIGGPFRAQDMTRYGQSARRTNR